MGQPENALSDHDREKLLRRFMAAIKHSQVPGLELVEANSDCVMLRLPYRQELVGNPGTGVIHGGAITSLLDQVCGMAVVSAIAPEVDIAPTLDLRIDYMRPATPGQDVFAKAHVYRLTKSVAFARGVAFQGSEDKPIAHCVGNFMRLGMKNVQWSSKQRSTE